MTPTTITRAAIIAHLQRRFEAQPFVLAAWLGGSDATGRTDELSDVDFQVIVEESAVEEAFALLRRSLEELGPIEHAHRLPEPAWHGLSQEFLRLRDSDPQHFVDFAVLRSDTPPEKRLLEVERHGVPLVLFDRGDWLRAPRLDREAHRTRLRTRLEALRSTFELFGPLVTRSVRRGLPVEAVGFYQQFVLRPLVELLRMRHAPERFDFGLRYLDRDLPDEPRAFVESVAFPRDTDECEALRSRAGQRFRAELAALEAGIWTT